MAGNPEGDGANLMSRSFNAKPQPFCEDVCSTVLSMLSGLETRSL